MMKRVFTIAITSILFLAFLMPTLSAQPRKGLRGGQHRSGMQGLCQGMDLTDDQQSKIVDLRLKLQKELLPLRTELQGKVAEIQLMKTETAPNLNKIDKLIDNTQEVRAKMAKIRVRHQLEIRNLLTPEQQKIFDSRALKMPARKWHGTGMKRPGIGQPF